MRKKAVSKRRWHTVAVLAVGIAIGTAMTGTPASSHVGGTVAHLASHMKAYFFTKTRSDARYLRKVNNAWHEVGAASEPTFGDCGSSNYVSNYNTAEWNSVAFFKDANGVVHLRGAATTSAGVSSNCSTIFFLPAGYRPARIAFHPVVKYDSSLTNVAPFSLTIMPDGRIFTGNLGWLAGEVLSLEGVSFRAAQ